MSTSRFSCNLMGRRSVACGPVTWEAKPPACPVQSRDRCKRRWDVLAPDVRNEPHTRLRGNICFSWVTRGFPPEILVAFPLKIPGKFVHWAVGVTSETQSKCHAQCLPKRWPKNFVRGSEEQQQEGLLLPRHGCGGRKHATWQTWFAHRQLILKIILLPVSFRQQQPSGRNLEFLSAHASLCFVVEFGGRRFGHCSKLVKNTTFSEYYSGFFFFNLVRPALMISGTARMHGWYRVAWI